MKATEQHRIELAEAIEQSRASYEPDLTEWLARLEARRAAWSRKRREELDDAIAILGELLPLATALALVVDELHDDHVSREARALQVAARDVARTLGDRKAALQNDSEPVEDFRPEALPDRLVTTKG